MLTSGSSLSSRVFGGSISVPSSTSQLRDLRDALYQPYSVYDVGAFFLPLESGT